MIVIIRLDIEDGMKLYEELSAQHGYAHLSVHISALTALQKHIDSLLNKCDVASSPAAVTASCGEGTSQQESGSTSAAVQSTGR
mgnify:CR=1 FL=1